MSYTSEDFEHFDFRSNCQHGCDCFIDEHQAIAMKRANAKLPAIKKQWLEELLKDAPEVYSQALSFGVWYPKDGPKTNTHKARLVAIEKL